MVELRTPNPAAGGSSPSWPAKFPCVERGLFHVQKDRGILRRSKAGTQEGRVSDKKGGHRFYLGGITTVLIAAFFLGLVDLGLGKLMTLAFK